MGSYCPCGGDRWLRRAGAGRAGRGGSLGRADGRAAARPGPGSTRAGRPGGAPSGRPAAGRAGRAALYVGREPGRGGRGRGGDPGRRGRWPAGDAVAGGDLGGWGPGADHRGRRGRRAHQRRRHARVRGLHGAVLRVRHRGRVPAGAALAPGRAGRRPGLRRPPARPGRDPAGPAPGGQPRLRPGRAGLAVGAGVLGPGAVPRHAGRRPGRSDRPGGPAAVPRPAGRRRARPAAAARTAAARGHRPGRGGRPGRAGHPVVAAWHAPRLELAGRAVLALAALAALPGFVAAVAGILGRGSG